MKLRNLLIILFWACVIGLGLYISYLEFFKCGGMSGTYSDIPRWCYWLK